MRKTALLLLLGFVLIAAAGCVVSNPRIAPPPAKVEVIPGRPGPNHVWIAGHWKWPSRGKSGFQDIGREEGRTGFGSPATGSEPAVLRNAAHLSSKVSSWPSARVKGIVLPWISIVYSPGGKGMELAVLLTAPTSFPSFVLMMCPK
jgi:hypothetical protein